ncbi:MAG: hypothetical protein K5888_01170 [Lachnospiraceae bacterium]|nr:hypothetical protein [Lachnospiraceae bacterium]
MAKRLYRILILVMAAMICVSSFTACSSLGKKDSKESSEEDEEEEEETTKKKKKKKKKKEEETGGCLIKVYNEDDYPGDLSDCDEYETEGTESAAGFVFEATGKVNNFKIYRITGTNEDILIDPPVETDEPYDACPYYVCEILSVDKISTKTPLYVTVHVPDLSTDMVFSYEDKDGNLSFYRVQTFKGSDNIDLYYVLSATIRDSNEVYADMENYLFYFTSGAGGWETDMRVHEDGSFEGEYYDFNMGEIGEGYPDGTVYRARFSGHLGEMRDVDYNRYEADVLDIEYENEPGTEEIVDDMLNIYTEAYGIAGAKTLEIYAPEMGTGFLSDEYVDWVYWQFYDYESDEMHLPAEMPTYGLFNPDGGYGFYSRSLLVNNSILSSQTDLPGLKNIKSDIDYESNSYDFTDEYEGEYFIRNFACFDDKTYDLKNDQDEFVDKYTDMITDNKSDLYIFDSDDDEWMHDLVTVEGKECLYAIWNGTVDGREVRCNAKFVQSDKFVLVYAIVINKDSKVMDGELATFVLSKLMYLMPYGDMHDYLTTEGEDATVAKVILAEVQAKTSKDGNTYYLVADEIDLVTENDEELLKKYGMTADDLDYDFEIMGEDGKTVEYKISDKARFFIQYERSPYYNPMWPKDFVGLLNEYPDPPMYIFLDDNDNVILGYEMYLP